MQQRCGRQHGSQQLASQPQLASAAQPQLASAGASQLGSAAQLASSAQPQLASQPQVSSQQQSLCRWKRLNRQQRWPQPESQPHSGSQQPPWRPKNAEALLALPSTTRAPRTSAAKAKRRFISRLLRNRNGRGNIRLERQKCELAEWPGGHVVSADTPLDVGSPHVQRTTLETSSCGIVYVVRRPLPTGRICRIKRKRHALATRCEGYAERVRSACRRSSHGTADERRGMRITE